MINDASVAQDILVEEFLQLEERRGLVATDIAEVIWAAAPHRECAWVLVLLDMYLVKGSVIVVFDPEGNGSQQLIVFHEFHVADGVDFFTSSDDLVGTVVVDEFQQV
jgi:hypothetical protein